MRPLMTRVDVVIANEEDIQSVLGLHVPDTDVTSGQLNLAGYRAGGRAADARVRARRWSRSRCARACRRATTAGARCCGTRDADAFHHSQRYDVRLVDRIGGGDSFAAGLIYGLVTGRAPEAALRFAVAASALKQTIPGDFNRVSVAEVDRLAGGDASGRVQR